MIETKNQYRLDVKIAGYDKDFLKEQDFRSFTAIEEAGNYLPSIELVFDTLETDLIERLNEGNEISIIMGRDKEDSILANYRIVTCQITRTGFNKYTIRLVAIYSIIDYYSTGKISISDEKTSMELVEEIVTPYFGVDAIDFSTVITKDKQKWIQYNITDKRFVNELWMHSHINENTFLILGISSDGIFVVRDMKNIVGDDPAYTFRTGKQKTSDIVYLGDAVVSSDAGFLNHWAGYGRLKHMYDLENGTEIDELDEISTMLQNADKLPRASEITQRIGEVAIKNENTHDNYWNAYGRNIQFLAAFSNIKLTLSFGHRYERIKVLDLVEFGDIKPNTQMEYVEPYAGRYIVCKVSRTIEQRQIITTVQMCRESFTGIQGNLR